MEGNRARGKAAQHKTLAEGGRRIKNKEANDFRGRKRTDPGLKKKPQTLIT